MFLSLARRASATFLKMPTAASRSGAPCVLQQRYRSSIPLKEDEDDSRGRRYFTLQKGERNICDHYELGRELGRGRFGRVQEATARASGERVAVKSIPIQRIYDQSMIAREIEILGSNDHPNLMSSVDTLVTESHVHIVSDMYDGDELYERIVEREDDCTFTEDEIAVTMYQVLRGLHDMHSRGIVHRDIKPENIMFKELGGWELALIDFGMSTQIGVDALGARSLRSHRGSPSYVAPEILDGAYDERADVWSAGVVMYILTCGKAPFKGRSSDETFDLIQQGKYDIVNSEWKGQSDAVKNVVDGLLQLDPDKRMSAEEALAQPLFHKMERSDGLWAMNPETSSLGLAYHS